VSEAILCASCGAKFSADRDRCPRCRERVKVVDHAAVAARSRRLQKVGGGLLAVAVIAVAAVWLLAPGPASTAVAPPTGGDPLAGRRGATPAPPAEAPKTIERPFREPSDRAHESYQAGDYEAALEHLQQAVEKNPRDAESLSNLGQVLVRLGRVEEALPYFDRAIGLNGDRWAYVFNRARAAALLERWTESIEGYRRAQTLFPNDYVTTYNLALTLHKSGNEEAAVAEYQKAIALAPEDGGFRRALGISLEKLNRPADAAAAYTEYLKLSPNAPDADKVRERIAQLTSGKLSPESSS
jgi:tetratricopeptide (TPR) repeat protein